MNFIGHGIILYLVMTVFVMFWMILESDIVIGMEKCFDEAIESDYIDYEKRTLCFRSAAIMDSVINGK